MIPQSSPILLLFLCATLSTANAQQPDLSYIPAQPLGGMRQLGQTYHSIGFTRDQRTHLGQAGEFQLIFIIDTTGYAQLTEVKGLSQQDVIDSLKSRKAPRFSPATLNGKKQTSQQVFPFSYPFGPRNFNTVCYGMFDVENVKEIKTSGQVEFAIRGLVNIPVGDLGNYLYPGGGGHMEGAYKPREKTGFGGAMGVYGNRFKSRYPVDDNIALRNTAVTIYFAGLINRLIYQRPKNEIHLQAELAYNFQSVAYTEDDREDNDLMPHGFSSGLSLRYGIRLGKERLHFDVGNPSIQAHRLEFHTTVHRTFFDLKEASGYTIEAGVSYRLIGKFVSYFRLD